MLSSNDISILPGSTPSMSQNLAEDDQSEDESSFFDANSTPEKATRLIASLEEIAQMDGVHVFTDEELANIPGGMTREQANAMTNAAIKRYLAMQTKRRSRLAPDPDIEEDGENIEYNDTSSNGSESDENREDLEDVEDDEEGLYYDESEDESNLNGIGLDEELLREESHSKRFSQASVDKKVAQRAANSKISDSVNYDQQSGLCRVDSMLKMYNKMRSNIKNRGFEKDYQKVKSIVLSRIIGLGLECSQRVEELISNYKEALNLEGIPATDTEEVEFIEIALMILTASVGNPELNKEIKKIFNDDKRYDEFITCFFDISIPQAYAGSEYIFKDYSFDIGKIMSLSINDCFTDFANENQALITRAVSAVKEGPLLTFGLVLSKATEIIEKGNQKQIEEEIPKLAFVAYLLATNYDALNSAIFQMAFKREKLEYAYDYLSKDCTKLHLNRKHLLSYVPTYEMQEFFKCQNSSKLILRSANILNAAKHVKGKADKATVESISQDSSCYSASGLPLANKYIEKLSEKGQVIAEVSIHPTLRNISTQYEQAVSDNKVAIPFIKHIKTIKDLPSGLGDIEVLLQHHDYETEENIGVYKICVPESHTDKLGIITLGQLKALEKDYMDRERSGNFSGMKFVYVLAADAKLIKEHKDSQGIMLLLGSEDGKDALALGFKQAFRFIYSSRIFLSSAIVRAVFMPKIDEHSLINDDFIKTIAPETGIIASARGYASTAVGYMNPYSYSISGIISYVVKLIESFFGSFGEDHAETIAARREHLKQFLEIPFCEFEGIERIYKNSVSNEGQKVSYFDDCYDISTDHLPVIHKGKTVEQIKKWTGFINSLAGSEQLAAYNLAMRTLIKAIDIEAQHPTEKGSKELYIALQFHLSLLPSLVMGGDIPVHYLNCFCVLPETTLNPQMQKAINERITESLGVVKKRIKERKQTSSGGKDEVYDSRRQEVSGGIWAGTRKMFSKVAQATGVTGADSYSSMCKKKSVYTYAELLKVASAEAKGYSKHDDLSLVHAFIPVTAKNVTLSKSQKAAISKDSDAKQPFSAAVDRIAGALEGNSDK